MVVRILASVVMVAAAGAAAWGAPSVTLTGDAEVVVEVGALLEQRGIASGAHGETVARVERHGEDLVVTFADDSRTVRSTATAAAVIESFVRDDVGSPLLARRSVPEAAPVISDTAPVITPRRRTRTGWHFTAAIESSVDDDGIGWGGMQIGACIMLGPFCAGARLRGSSVATDDPEWKDIRRMSSEALLGLDLPIGLGRYLLMPGVAAGWGGVTTKTPELPMQPSQPSRSDNFRAQLHVAFAYPLTTSLAVDIYAAGTLVQQVEREPGYMDDVPSEPLGFFRFGVGLRYGRR